MSKQAKDDFSVEFSRLVSVEKIKSLGLRDKIAANQSERCALSARLGVLAVGELSFTYELQPWKKGGVRLKGIVNAQVEETCVVTLEPFKTTFNEDVERIFTHAASPGVKEDVVDLENLDEDIPDTITNNAIDLGEVATETLALVLSPYPRKPGAQFSNHMESDPAQDAETATKNPFAVLKSLKSD
jgi:uncharacterized metal-binding protein YceD (DUF177 family)